MYEEYNKLYQRLRAIEPTLAPALPENNYLEAYNAALQSVAATQLNEVQFLRRYHQLPANAFVILNENMLTPLERLEQQSHNLDDFNGNIILEGINKDSTSLNLRGRHLTRFPRQLFEKRENGLTEYWKKLKNFSSLFSISCARILIISNSESFL